MPSPQKIPSMQTIILIGPPGSGKGTQSFILMDHVPNAFYFETSSVIEENVMNAKKSDFVMVDGKKYSLVHERELWKTGILCTPAVVSFWVKEKFKNLAAQRRSLIIAGSPRTLPEGKSVMPVLAKLYGKKNIVIISLRLSAKQSVFRNSHRRMCKLFRHPILFTPETKKLTKCPLDGSPLFRREGLDDPKVVAVRLKEYEERTKPLLDFFRKCGYPPHYVNGEQSPEDVARDISRVLKRLKIV